MKISQIVDQAIHQSPFILEALDAGIINTSSLARYLQPEITRQIGEPVTQGAIMMAIKRLPISNNQQLEKSISNFMYQLGDITVRSSLSDFSFRNSTTLLQCQGKLLQYLEDHKNYFYSFCKGVYETTIICSEALTSKIQTIFKDEHMILSRTDLAAVSINLPSTNLDTYGVYYTILKKLAWKGINIVEVLSTSHEISLIISKSDVESVFSMIISLKRGNTSLS